jgi:hypothetical protein
MVLFLAGLIGILGIFLEDWRVLERDVERYLVGKVEALGGLCLKFTSSIAGVPDRVVIVYGVTYFVELKATGKKPRPLQDRIIAKMQKAGAAVYIISAKAGVDTFLTECYNSSLNRGMTDDKKSRR